MNSEGNSYFCTTVQGLEYFLVQEIKEKLQVEQVECKNGNVLFSTGSDVDSLHSLKSAERLLIKVDHRCVKFPNGRGKCRKKIKQITESISTWEKSLQVWKHFQERQNNIEDECSVEAESCNSGETCNNDDVWRKRENDSEHLDKRMRTETSDSDVAMDAHSGKSIERGGMLKDDDENQHLSMETSEIDKLSYNNTATENVRFRITCKCVGKAKKYHSPQEFAICMGTCLARKFGWQIDVRKPQLEILVFVTPTDFLIGFPTTHDYLSKRSYIKKTGMRSTIAWCMCQLAELQSGHLLLDPMCASGIIVLEALKSCKKVYCIGCDHHSRQLEQAALNIQYASMNETMQLMQTDAKGIPLKMNSVDRVICDLPFGLHHNTHIDIKQFYLSFLGEVTRVVKSNGRAVLLTSAVMVDYLIKVMTGEKSRLWRVVSAEHQNKDITDKDEEAVVEMCPSVACWIKVETHFLKVGLASAYICVFRKK
ncbi:U6 snRNA (guanine-N(2))-methyltransferase THUMPD2-like [Saccoglossus kowalevskii]